MYIFAKMNLNLNDEIILSRCLEEIIQIFIWIQRKENWAWMIIIRENRKWDWFRRWKFSIEKEILYHEKECQNCKKNMR